MKRRLPPHNEPARARMARTIARAAVGIIAWTTSVGLDAARLGAADPPTALFVMKIDGSATRNVAQVEGYKKHGSPRWSHDGRRLAFEASQGAGEDKFYVVNVDGSQLEAMGPRDARLVARR